MKFFRNSFVIIIVSLSSVIILLAQANEGRVLGTVTDATGAVVAGAKVTVTNTATNVTRNLVSNRAGDYVAPDLEAGSYKVSAEAPGFKKAESTSFPLEVSRDARVDLRLQPGAVSETVEVIADATLVDTTDSTLNGVLSNKAINELPLQGRDFQNLLPLHPGVQRTPGGGFHSVTSNGNRPDDNNFYIDGADDNDVYYGETVVNDAGIQGTPASVLPLDAIQEFNTQEAPAADFGVKPGVVMSIGLKSGTNDLHGTAYYFHRNSAFDARNYFNPAPTTLSALLLHQFGASLGGPIKKDKWFYFVSYEGIRDRVGNPGVVDSPVTVSLIPQAGLLPAGTSPADYSIVDAIAGCQPACSPLSVQLSKLLLPNPGFTASRSDPAAIDFDFNNTNRGDNLVVKTDYSLNQRNALSARLIYSNTNQVEEDAFPLRPDWLSTTSPRTQVFGVTWTWTASSRWINQARFSYNRFYEAIQPLDHNVNPIAYGLNTGVTDPRLFGFPRINPGSNNFNYMGGNSSWPLNTTPTSTENVSDTLSYTAGKHALRFGGEYRYGSVNYLRAGYGRGRIDFSDLESFFAGDVRRWRLLYGDAARDVNLKAFGLFVQDDYRIFPRLTLNLGLRYDVTYPLQDSRNLLANYVPTAGIVQVGKGISSPYDTNYNNVSPRVGFAWDMFGTGKTVLRASGGIIYEQPSVRTFMFNGGGLNLNPTTSALGITPGNGTINSFLEISSDPTQINWGTGSGTIFPASSGATCSLSNQCTVFGVNQHIKTPYVANWNLNIQQALTPTTLLQVAYVANHGIKLYSATDLNQVNPALDDGSETIGRPLVTNCPVSQGGLGRGGPCFPYIGYLDYLSNQSNSNYNSLQVTLTKRYSHGLYLLAGYTYAHAIDTATSNIASLPPNSLNYAAERGNGDYDIRNRLTVSATYDLPSMKSKWQMLEGWQMTTIAMLEGGLPYTLGDFNDDISLTGEFNDRWNMVGSPSNIHWSAKNPIPYFPFLDSNGNPVPGNSACLPYASLSQLQTYGCYVSGSTIITPPEYGQSGNMGRNIFRGPSFRNWDFSLSKIWRLNERVRMQFRGEVFNILNHTNFDTLTMNTDLSVPNTVGTVVFTPDVAAANPVVGSGGSRHIQLGAKIIW